MTVVGNTLIVLSVFISRRSTLFTCLRVTILYVIFVLCNARCGRVFVDRELKNPRMLCRPASVNAVYKSDSLGNYSFSQY